MINLMYIVLTAMLALSVSSDVLDGFGQVDEGLSRSNANVESRNTALLDRLEAVASQNPEKGGAWRDKAVEIHSMTGSLYALIDTLKLAIAVEADGDDADPGNLRHPENREASSVVMVTAPDARGEELRKAIERYREQVTALVPDPVKRDNLQRALSTDPMLRDGALAKRPWEEALFLSKPAVASVTMLTKLQNDLLYAEGEVLGALLANVDAGDVRVNELRAFVIPSSRNVMRGASYRADIVLAAVDTTQRPRVYIDGRRLDNDRGVLEIDASSTGAFSYSGYIELPHHDGTVTRHDFESTYNVIEPGATVSAKMMNVLYAGIDNPLGISVPGVPQSSVSATMTNGSLVRRGDEWIARPDRIGEQAVVTVTADIDGSRRQVASIGFMVRRLPDPAPYMTITDQAGNKVRYRGSKPIAKSQLMQAQGVEAAIDDNLLDVNYRVLGFETLFFDSMGNAMPELSDGPRFSSRQREAFKRLSRGKRFFISRVRAVGPDGVERDISPMEVIVN